MEAKNMFFISGTRQSSVIWENEHSATVPLTKGSRWWRTGTACVVLHEGFLDGTREGELSVSGGRGRASGRGRLCSDEGAAKKQLQ